VQAVGLDLFPPEDEHANVVTVARVPDGIDGTEVPKRIRKTYGITIAGGQGHLKGKILRIAHCGYYGAFDILSTIAALEMTLRELGADVSLGAGVAAAQQVFLEAGVPTAQPVG
jgi:aspartate aminotransferase-like enzyme